MDSTDKIREGRSHRPSIAAAADKSPWALPPDASAATVDDLTHYMQMVARYRDALIECATIAGADVSGGVPTSPSVDVWAVQEVAQLRKDYDEAIHDPA